MKKFLRVNLLLTAAVAIFALSTRDSNAQPNSWPHLFPVAEDCRWFVEVENVADLNSDKFDIVYQAWQSFKDNTDWVSAYGITFLKCPDGLCYNPGMQMCHWPEFCMNINHWLYY